MKQCKHDLINSSVLKCCLKNETAGMHHSCKRLFQVAETVIHSNGHQSL